MKTYSRLDLAESEKYMTFNSIREYARKTDGTVVNWKVLFSVNESNFEIVLDREEMEKLAKDLQLTLNDK